MLHFLYNSLSFIEYYSSIKLQVIGFKATRKGYFIRISCYKHYNSIFAHILYIIVSKNMKSYIHYLYWTAKSYKRNANHRESQSIFKDINSTFHSFQTLLTHEFTGSIQVTASRTFFCPQEAYNIEAIVSSVKMAFGIFIRLQASGGLLQHFHFIDVPNQVQMSIENSYFFNILSFIQSR